MWYTIYIYLYILACFACVFVLHNIHSIHNVIIKTTQQSRTHYADKAHHITRKHTYWPNPCIHSYFRAFIHTYIHTYIHTFNLRDHHIDMIQGNTIFTVVYSVFSCILYSHMPASAYKAAWGKNFWDFVRSFLAIRCDPLGLAIRCSEKWCSHEICRCRCRCRRRFFSFFSVVLVVVVVVVVVVDVVVDVVVVVVVVVVVGCWLLVVGRWLFVVCCCLLFCLLFVVVVVVAVAPIPI